MSITYIPIKHQQQGFSLLEILVSIIILSFGILGAVGLQAASLQANRDSRLQSAGVRFAYEMGELLRANHQTALKTTTAENPYLIDIKGSTHVSTPLTCGLPATNSPACTTKQIAERDLNDWLTRIAAELPGSRAVICFDNKPYDSAGLPQWDCNGLGNSLSIKLGWTRANTLTGATGTDATNTASANTGAFDKALRPAVVIPVTPGVN